MGKFKTGDKVVCIYNENTDLYLGKIYTISGRAGREEHYFLQGEEENWMGSRFELAEEDALEPEDVVNNPKHYQSHPSGVECITVTEHMGFNLGNAVKYIWRCDLKKDAIEDLKKAKFYIEREIALRESK